MIFFILVSILWSIVFLKKLFFWVYLWQLKEYHIGRFKDHFSTYKGKKLIFNYLLLLKILILLAMFGFSKMGLYRAKEAIVYFAWAVLFVETLFVFRNAFLKRLKKPVFRTFFWRPCRSLIVVHSCGEVGKIWGKSKSENKKAPRLVA